MILRTLVISLFLLPVLSDSLRAAFILDDFDDPAEVVSPEMEGIEVITEHVGDIDAVRSLVIEASRSDPSGRIDTNITTGSRLSMQLTGHEKTTTTLAPIIFFDVVYDVSAADVSETGLNNAIFLDFVAMTGTESPTLIRSFIFDETSPSPIFEATIPVGPSVSTPTRAVVPFNNFTFRGGAPGLPDFTAVDKILFDFYFLGPSEDIQWSAELDRIRFGRIPEPSCVSLVCAVLTICICGRTRFGVRFLVRGG